MINEKAIQDALDSAFALAESLEAILIEARSENRRSAARERIERAVDETQVNGGSIVSRQPVSVVTSIPSDGDPFTSRELATGIAGPVPEPGEPAVKPRKKKRAHSNKARTVYRDGWIPVVRFSEEIGCSDEALYRFGREKLITLAKVEGFVCIHPQDVTTMRILRAEMPSDRKQPASWIGRRLREIRQAPPPGKNLRGDQS